MTLPDASAPSESAPQSRSGRVARALARQLRSDIILRRSPGEKLPTERDLARRHHCAVSTVRAALAVLAGEGMVVRLHGSGTYVPDPLPRLTRTTGLLFFADARVLLSEPYYRNVLEGMLDAATGSDQEVHLILGRHRHPAGVTSAILAGLQLERFNSIVCLEVFNHDLLEQLAQGRPVVSVDFACHRPGVSSCAISHAQTLDAAVDQCWLLGHRRIAYFGSTATGSDPAHPERQIGYRHAMKKRDLDRYIHQLPLTSASDTVLHADALARMHTNSRPTAIIVEASEWELAEALVRHGLQIPRDISVLSLGVPVPWLTHLAIVHSRQAIRDVGVLMGEPVSDPLDPRLTSLRLMVFSSVALPFHTMGQWAMQEVVRRLKDPESPPQFQLMPGTPTPGNTIGSPA